MGVMVPLTILDRVDAEHFFCPVIMCFASGIFFTNTMMVGYLAFERYIYFSRPFKHAFYFSKNRILLVNICVYAFGLLTAVIIEVSSGRKLVTTTISCSPVGLDAQKTNMAVFILFWVPSATISVMSVISLRVLTYKHKAQVAAQTDESVTNQADGQIFQGALKAIRMILIVSGAFWTSVMPGALLRIILAQAGVTWKDTDARQNVNIFAISRIAYLLMTVLSSFLNPIIYMTLQKDLRYHVYHVLGIRNQIGNIQNQP